MKDVSFCLAPVSACLPARLPARLACLALPARPPARLPGRFPPEAPLEVPRVILGNHFRTSRNDATVQSLSAPSLEEEAMGDEGADKRDDAHTHTVSHVSCVSHLLANSCLRIGCTQWFSSQVPQPARPAQPLLSDKTASDKT